MHFFQSPPEDPDAFFMNKQSSNPFTTIYDSHEWQGESLSGPGSDGERTIEFREYLARFLAERRIRKVVDFGCGDWSYSKLMNWSGIEYLGVDVVPSVIERNQRRFGRENVNFICMDPSRQELPDADLFLSKEVLQHLPSAKVLELLGAAKAYKYALLVNDTSHRVRRDWRKFWRWDDACETNVDIPAGNYRLLSLRDPPFSLKATQVLTYENVYKGMRWTKEVLLHERDAA